MPAWGEPVRPDGSSTGARARANAPPTISGKSEMTITPTKARVPEASVPTKSAKGNEEEERQDSHLRPGQP